MNIVKDLLTPIITMSILVAFVSGMGWLVYRGLNKLMPDLNLWVKYSVFKKKMNEDSIAWCFHILQSDGDEVDAEMLLLKKGFSPQKIKDMLYIFRQVQKELKGEVEEKDG